ncbi:MAG: hypothetical protein IE935_09650, partial [Micrococcales bacterium]|nr:hypothetical protein [Micrococcales bacterium]
MALLLAGEIAREGGLCVCAVGVGEGMDAGRHYLRTRMPHLSTHADAAAEDILRRAAHGRAFDALSQLIGRYRG